MRLIGMLDSPYVRRVAVSMRLLDLPFRHEPLSVFRDFEAIAAINPLVKVPTLVLDDGTTLLDSTLILAHLERCAGRSLAPADPALRARSLHLVGVALACCEKTVQVVYEHVMRPPERRHAPWLTRVETQMRSGFRLLDEAVPRDEGWLFGDAAGEADILIAIAWTFAQNMAGGFVEHDPNLNLSRFTAQAETLAAFRTCPYGEAAAS